MTETRARRGHPGVRVRHARTCPARGSGRCGCKPAYEAWVYLAKDDKKVRKTFPTLAAAKGWRADALAASRRGALRPPSRLTLREAATTWVTGAQEGTIKNRSGRRYKPSALRSYEQALERHVLPDLGGARLSEIGRFDLQDLADRLSAAGLDGSSVRNALMPLRAIYRRALARGEISVNPTTGLELAAPGERPRRIVTPDEAEALLAELSKPDRPLWASAFYAGLRRGELLALRWQDVDLGSGVISVEQAWDDKTQQFVAPKSVKGRRRVPVTPILRDFLDEHKLATGRADGLVFGPDGTRPPSASALWRRGRAAATRAGIAPISLQEARHTFASLLIAAGVNAKAISSYMGHAGIQITFDTYGHLMPGNENEAAELLDQYLTRPSGGAAPRTQIRG